MEKYLIVLCQGQYQSIREEWTEMHALIQEVSKHIEVKKSWSGGTGQNSVEKDAERQCLTSGSKMHAFERRSALRDNL